MQHSTFTKLTIPTGSWSSKHSLMRQEMINAQGTGTPSGRLVASGERMELADEAGLREYV